jgi:hypothetical protein
MLESPIFQLIALVLLAAYLWFSMERRRRAEEAEWLADEREKEEARRQAWEDMTSGAALDVGRLVPEIQRLRENHLAALHVRPHEAFYRRGLVAMFRKLVTSRSLFQRERMEREPQKHGA